MLVMSTHMGCLHDKDIRTLLYSVIAIDAIPFGVCCISIWHWWPNWTACHWIWPLKIQLAAAHCPQYLSCPTMDLLTSFRKLQGNLMISTPTTVGIQELLALTTSYLASSTVRLSSHWVRILLSTLVFSNIQLFCWSASLKCPPLNWSNQLT